MLNEVIDTSGDIYQKGDFGGWQVPLGHAHIAIVLECSEGEWPKEFFGSREASEEPMCSAPPCQKMF